MTTNPTQELTRKDFIAPVDVRWCPGCGDYAILNAVQKVFPTLGIPKENFVVISGIGCSSRFPYYMNTYGFHSIHGRAPTLATGVKVSNPDLSVWVITGDGDGLSIGGNHLMHALRRNLDVNILLFNNQIYGLTKGQYSPTSKPGTTTKTSPAGSIDHPINPVEFALASQATFVARTVDTNPKHMAEVFAQAAAHKGTSFVEIMQNCVIFNDKVWEDISSRQVRDDRLVMLEQGKPLLFGKEKPKGIRLNGLQPEVVTIGENGVTEDDVHVHDASLPRSTYAQILAGMKFPDFPTPMGVIREVSGDPTYEGEVEEQIKESIRVKGKPHLAAILKGKEYWEVKDEDTDVRPGGSGPKGNERTEEMEIMAEQISESVLVSSDALTSALRRPIHEAIEQYGTYDVISVSPEDSFSEVIETLRSKNLGAVPVVDKKGALIGILSERDILMDVVLSPLDRDSHTVEDIMTKNPETVSEMSTVGNAINVLSSGNFRHLPIVGRKGRLGLISVKGLMRYLATSHLTD